MIATKDLPPGIRPVRLTEQRVLQLARRSVYFPVRSHTNAARYYKGDVRAAISHGLALEWEYAEAQERHQTEVDALNRRITALQTILHRRAGPDCSTRDERARRSTTRSGSQALHHNTRHTSMQHETRVQDLNDGGRDHARGDAVRVMAHEPDGVSGGLPGGPLSDAEVDQILDGMTDCGDRGSEQGYASSLVA